MDVGFVESKSSAPALALQDPTDSGYIFNAGTDLLAPSMLQAYSSTSASSATGGAHDRNKENTAAGVRPSFEAPNPTIAAAFLAKASGPNTSDYTSSQQEPGSDDDGTATAFDVLLPDSAVLEQFSADLIPYYLCQYELEGIAVTARPIPSDLPPEARKAAKSTPMSSIPEFESLAISVMQQARPSLAGLDEKDVKLEMRSMAEVLKLACDARMTDGRSEVPLSELMYDDAFVHGLVNFQQQPSKQLLDMLKWLLEEVSEMHAQGQAHGSISLACIMCHPADGWRLVQAGDGATLTDSQQTDIDQVARIMCFMCLSSEHRRSYQPHHLGQLSNYELLGLVSNVPDVRMVADAMFAGRATLAKALDFHIWHPLAVHAQVMLDTKAVMRSMRLGSEDFDANYNNLVLRNRSWKDVLGYKLIPDVIVASRQHVLRSDFAPYDFDSSASLLRFTANTIGHFEELQLGLQLSKVAFLDAILALFPALVPVCYHYLAAYPSLHVRNRDSELVFGAIEGDVDATHRIMHNALSGYTDSRLWHLSCLEGFKIPAAKKLDPELEKEFGQWRCRNPECDGSACTLWHDERELRFAKLHLCRDFMEGVCRRTACPKAHGFAEIRDAMNDASPICWRWLEGRCHVSHCKYAHTFRRHHSSQRPSVDSNRSSFSKKRLSQDSRRRSFQVADNRKSGDRRRSGASTGGHNSFDANRLDGPAENFNMAALEHSLMRQAKLPIKPVPTRKSMDGPRTSLDQPKPWTAMPRVPAGVPTGGEKVQHGSASGSMTGSSGSGDENLNGKTWGKGKAWVKGNRVMPHLPMGKGFRSGTFSRRAQMVDSQK